MALPAPDTPLYNHPLPEIEAWLRQLGGRQDTKELHAWRLDRPGWQAQLCLETEELRVVYSDQNGKDIQRSFKYSLSRRDIEDAILAGP
jgi:hypothetical protein